MIAVSMATFVLVSISPIDPVQANVGQAALINMSAGEARPAGGVLGCEHAPVGALCRTAITAAFQGDLGTSLRYNAPVADVIATRALNSLALMATAWVVSGVLGFALGILAGANRGGSWTAS